jgi:CubicO group peptidase (beta-lactamase class C family)
MIILIGCFLEPNTITLQQVVEVVSGLPLQDFFQREIFGPLDMKDTGSQCFAKRVCNRAHVPPFQVIQRPKGMLFQYNSTASLPHFLSVCHAVPHHNAGAGVPTAGFFVREDNRHRLGPFYRASDKTSDTGKRELFVVDGAGTVCDGAGAGASAASGSDVAGVGGIAQPHPACGYTEKTHSPLYSGGGGVCRIKGERWPLHCSVGVFYLL